MHEYEGDIGVVMCMGGYAGRAARAQFFTGRAGAGGRTYSTGGRGRAWQN